MKRTALCLAVSAVMFLTAVPAVAKGGKDAAPTVQEIKKPWAVNVKKLDVDGKCYLRLTLECVVDFPGSTIDLVVRCP